MRKIFVLLCIFSLFLSLSCSKKSESNETSVEKGVTSEDTNKINNEDNTDMSENDDFSGSGLEGFMLDDGNQDYYEDSESQKNKSSLAASSSKEGSSYEESSDGDISNTEAEAEIKAEPVVEKPKDLVPPGPISNLKGYYNGAKNAVVISWTEPDDSDFSHVKITSNGKKQGISKKGTTTFDVDAQTLGNYDISVVSYDYSGNAGPAVNFSIETKFFDSASMPSLAGTAGKGRPIRVAIKGTNFKVEGVTNNDFIASCQEDASIAKKATVNIVNDNTVYVDVKIPKKAGSYNIDISCGNNKVSTKFSVIDVATVGTVEKANDGTPVAILAGYNSLGLPFGVALNEQKGLKWASSFGYNEKFEKIMAIVPQEELGAGSAINANISGDLDGEDNWKAIVVEDSKASNLKYVEDEYPVFHYALTYGKSMPAGYNDGWFIPSLYELCQIYANKAKINEVITLLGKGKLIGDDFYWSSSQCDEEADKACAVRFNTGSIFKYKRKSDSVYGRCVRMMY